MRGLVHAATLAANSHNTQPWHFRIDEGQIGIHPDPARRCPAVDPDDHHLFVSPPFYKRDPAPGDVAHLIGEPHGQAAALAQAGVILGPVRDLAILFWDMVAAVLIRLERQDGRAGGRSERAFYAGSAPCNKVEIRVEAAMLRSVLIAPLGTARLRKRARRSTRVPFAPAFLFHSCGLAGFCRQLVHGFQSLCGIHDRGTRAHVDGHSQGFGYRLP